MTFQGGKQHAQNERHSDVFHQVLLETVARHARRLGIQRVDRRQAAGHQQVQLRLLLRRRLPQPRAGSG